MSKAIAIPITCGTVKWTVQRSLFRAWCPPDIGDLTVHVGSGVDPFEAVLGVAAWLGVVVKLDGVAGCVTVEVDDAPTDGPEARLVRRVTADE